MASSRQKKFDWKDLNSSRFVGVAAHVPVKVLPCGDKLHWENKVIEDWTWEVVVSAVAVVPLMTLLRMALKLSNTTSAGSPSTGSAFALVIPNGSRQTVTVPAAPVIGVVTQGIAVDDHVIPQVNRIDPVLTVGVTEMHLIWSSARNMAVACTWVRSVGAFWTPSPWKNCTKRFCKKLSAVLIAATLKQLVMVMRATAA